MIARGSGSRESDTGCWGGGKTSLLPFELSSPSVDEQDRDWFGTFSSLEVVVLHLSPAASGSDAACSGEMERLSYYSCRVPLLPEE